MRRILVVALTMENTGEDRRSFEKNMNLDVAFDEEDDIFKYETQQCVDKGDGFVEDDEYCLVGRFLTRRNIDFDAMRHLYGNQEKVYMLKKSTLIDSCFNFTTKWIFRESLT